MYVTTNNLNNVSNISGYTTFRLYFLFTTDRHQKKVWETGDSNGMFIQWFLSATANHKSCQDYRGGWGLRCCFNLGEEIGLTKTLSERVYTYKLCSLKHQNKCLFISDSEAEGKKTKPQKSSFLLLSDGRRFLLHLCSQAVCCFLVREA